MLSIRPVSEPLYSTPEEYEVCEQAFRSLFGIGPAVCGHLWDHFSYWKWLPPKMRPKHLLWALLFLKVYSTEAVLSSIAKTSRKTLRKWVWLLLPLIADMRPFVVSKRAQQQQFDCVLILTTAPSLSRFAGIYGSGVIRARLAK
jgi:hypothetical protein